MQHLAGQAEAEDLSAAEVHRGQVVGGVGEAVAVPRWLVSDRGAFLVAQEIEVAGERARAHLQLPAEVAAVGQPSAGHAFPHHRDDAAQAVIFGPVLWGFGAHFFL